jgi:hypothetical protein
MFLDTFYGFGDSRTIIINAAVLPLRWFTQVCQTEGAYEVNNGSSGSVINTWNGNSMQARVNTIPTKIAHRSKLFWWFHTNDIQSALSVDSFAKGYRICLDTATRRSWTGADQYILFGWTPSQALITQTLYRDSAKAIAASYGITFIDFSGISTFGERTIYNRMVGNSFYYDGTTHEGREGNNYIASYVLPRVKYGIRYDNKNTFTNNGLLTTDKLKFVSGDTATTIPTTSIAGVNYDGRFVQVPYQQIVHDNPVDSLGQSATINLAGDAKANQLLATGIPTTSANVQATRIGFNGTTTGGLIFAGNGAGTFYNLRLGSTGKVLIGSAGDAINTVDAFQVTGGTQANYHRANALIGSWSGKGSDISFDPTNNIGRLESRGSTGGTWYTTALAYSGGGAMIGNGTDKGFGLLLYKSFWLHKDSIPHATATGSMEVLVADTTGSAPHQIKRITIPTSTSALALVQTADATITNSTGFVSAIGTGVGSNIVTSGTLTVGKRIHLQGFGIVSTDASPPSFSITFSNSSSTSAVPGTLTGSMSNVQVAYDFYATVITTGASGSIMMSGYIDVNGVRSNLASSTTTLLNTTVSQTFDVLIHFGTANTNNTFVSKQNFLSIN